MNPSSRRHRRYWVAHGVDAAFASFRTMPDPERLIVSRPDERLPPLLVLLQSLQQIAVTRDTGPGARSYDVDVPAML
jgi:hypothetical protein